MTNLERHRHKIAFLMDLGGGWGVIDDVPVTCGLVPCKDCVAYKGRNPKENESACDTEKIISWMLFDAEKTAEFLKRSLEQCEQEGKDAEH